MPRLSSPHVTRRQFLVGGGAAVAGAALLGACGGDDDAASTTSTTSKPGSLALIQFFGGAMFAAGSQVRAPFGLADVDGLLPLDRSPESLTIEVLDPAGGRHGDPVKVARRSDGLPRAYYPLDVAVDDPGVYTARTSLGDEAVEMTLKIDAPSDIKVIQVGQKMPALETPTIADARGVNPICTRDPVCPLHDATVTTLLAEKAPFALLVASPAFCQIAICGPVLDVLLDVQDAFPQIRFVHAEVFADPAKDQDTYAPVVGALGLHYEPALVLVGADGTVADRIDTIYDRSEVEERLTLLV